MGRNIKFQHVPCAAHRNPHNDGDRDASDQIELLLSSADEGAGKDAADGVEEHGVATPDSLPDWPQDMELGATRLPLE